MEWARMLAYITGTVDRELLLRNEYLTTENRILKAQVKGRLLFSVVKILQRIESPQFMPHAVFCSIFCPAPHHT